MVATEKPREVRRRPPIAEISSPGKGEDGRRPRRKDLRLPLDLAAVERRCCRILWALIEYSSSSSSSKIKGYPANPADPTKEFPPKKRQKQK